MCHTVTYVYSLIIVTFSANISIECSFNLQLRRISYISLLKQNKTKQNKTMDGNRVFL